METLQKRIMKLELKINPTLTQTIDLVQVVRDIRIERARLESLTAIEAEKELAKPTESRIIQAARTGFLNRNCQEGLVPSSEATQTPKNPAKDWIVCLMEERRKAQ